MNQAEEGAFHLRIHGMDCAEEVTLLKRELLPVVGNEERLGFDVLNGKLLVDISDLDITRGDVLAAIKRTGLTSEPWEDTVASEEQSFWQKHQRSILTTVSGLFGLAGLVVQLSSDGKSGSCAANIHSALRHRHRRGTDNGIAKGMAFARFVAARHESVDVCGCGWSGTNRRVVRGSDCLHFLFSFSLLLESWSVGRARRAIASLMDLSPPIAHFRGQGGEVRDVAPAEVPVGSTVIVRPGEKIPLDGRISKGASSIDQAPITGESVPIDKESDDEVFAGTINGDGLLEIVTTKAADDTTLARIIKMVGDAGSKRSPSEKWVGKNLQLSTRRS